MKRFKNTNKKGEVRLIIFRDNSEKDQSWYGVALDFNIVISAETKKEAFYILNEAVEGYLHVAKSINGLKDFSMLNQKSQNEYEELWLSLVDKKPITSPYQVEFFGLQSIHA